MAKKVCILLLTLSVFCQSGFASNSTKLSALSFFILNFVNCRWRMYNQRHLRRRLRLLHNRAEHHTG